MNLTFQATFFKVTTTVDGGWRLSLDLSQDQAEQMFQLAGLKDKLLQIAIIPVEVTNAER